MRPAPLVGDVEAVRLDETDMLEVSRFCLSCSEFYEFIEGQRATEATAAEVLGPLESAYAHGVKHVWGLRRARTLIVVAELLEDHPVVHDWYVGLLLVDPKFRRQGPGTQVCDGLLDWIAASGGSTVRLLVQQQNADAQILGAPGIRGRLRGDQAGRAT